MVRLGSNVPPQFVHRLVAEAFIGPAPDGQVVRHLNDEQFDNRLSNLAYGTHSENMIDRLRNGIHHYAARTHCNNGHEFTPENTEWRSDNPRARRCITCKKAKARAAYLRRTERSG